MSKIRIGHIGWLSRDEGPQVETVAWCDLNKEKLQRATEKHPDIEMYTDYREMARRADLDAVVISTPNDVHAEQCIAFLEAGADVFLEKPMGINREEFDDILRTVRETGRRLTVDFEMRVSPFARRVKELIDGGEYGELRRMEVIHHRGGWKEEGGGMWRVRPERSGGHVLMEPIHEIDIMRYFAGREVESVQNIAGPSVLDHYRFPDNMCIHLFFEEEVLGTILASHTASAYFEGEPTPERMDANGHDFYMIFTLTGASLWVDFLRCRILVNEIEEYPEGTGGKHVVQDRREIHCDGDLGEFAHDIGAMRKEFIRRCAEDRPPVQDAVDAWKTHVVSLTAEESAQDGKRMEIDYTTP